MTTRLESIRAYHDTFNERTIELPLGLFDPHVFLEIDLKYAKFLEVMYKHFPYMIKSQFYELYGKSKNTNIAAVNELIEMKVFKSEPLAGNHYLVPLSRMNQYFERKKKTFRYRAKPSLHKLLDSFMRAEYFLKTDTLLHTSPNVFFTQIDTEQIEHFKAKKGEKEQLERQIDAIKAEIAPFYEENGELSKDKIREVGFQGMAVLIEKKEELAKLQVHYEQLFEVFQQLQYNVTQTLQNFTTLTPSNELLLDVLAIEWQNKKGFDGEVKPTKSKTERHEFLRLCLALLSERGCYFKHITKESERLHLELAIIHHEDSTKKRYLELIDDISRICSVFLNGSFNMDILCESEFEKERATTIIKEVMSERLERQVSADTMHFLMKNYCTEYKIVNLNLHRYLYKHNIGREILANTDFTQLTEVLVKLELVK